VRGPLARCAGYATVSPMFLPFALVLAQSAGAWSGGRPPECGAESGGSATANVWERAKSPELRRYCDLVASAASKLAGTAVMAQAALAAAREADEILPGHAAPKVLEGRALAGLGNLDDALTSLRQAKAIDPAAFDEPLALLAWARVLARTGHAGEAAEAYRALLPRTESLSSADRVSAAVEAALAAMASGPAGLDDAIAALREALHEAQDEALNVTVLALALALDRRGDSGAARALLTERMRGDPRSLLEAPRAKELMLVAPIEASSLAGFALEPIDPAGARDAWEQYLASLSASPAHVKEWETHARAHLGALGAARSPARGRPR
jgi:tetratricopeptide (TPR) repeat protein